MGPRWLPSVCSRHPRHLQIPPKLSVALSVIGGRQGGRLCGFYLTWAPHSDRWAQTRIYY